MQPAIEIVNQTGGLEHAPAAFGNLLPDFLLDGALLVEEEIELTRRPDVV